MTPDEQYLQIIEQLDSIESKLNETSRRVNDAEALSKKNRIRIEVNEKILIGENKNNGVRGDVVSHERVLNDYPPRKNYEAIMELEGNVKSGFSSLDQRVTSAGKTVTVAIGIATTLMGATMALIQFGS